MLLVTDDALDFPRYVPFPRGSERLTSFSLLVGDEGQGTTIVLSFSRQPARARTRWDYAREENGFAFTQTKAL